MNDYTIDLGDKGFDTYYGNGLASLQMYNNEQEDEEIDIPESNENEKYILNANIIDLDWKNISSEELDSYFLNTESEYIGYFLTSLTESDLKEITEKSDKLKSTISVSHLQKTDDNDSEYTVVTETEVNYATYCIDSYNEIKDEVNIQEWTIKNNGTFYMSFNNRKISYKYTVKDLVNTSRWEADYDSSTDIIDIESDITVTRELAYGTASSNFKPPKFKSLDIVIASARCHEWEFNYTEDGESKSTTGKGYVHIPVGNDNGLIQYDMSIKFDNYAQDKDGYHTRLGSIKTYKWDSSITAKKNETLDYNKTGKITYYGDTEETTIYVNRASYKDYEYVAPDGSYVTVVSTPTNIGYQTLNDKKVFSGKLVVYYNGVYKSGHAYAEGNENTQRRSELASESRKTINGAKRAVGDHTLDTSKTKDSFTLQFSLVSSIGLKNYTGPDGVLVWEADIPNYSFEVEPNEGTVLFDGNGGTLIRGKSTPSSKTMKYSDTTISLPNPGDYWAITGYHIVSADNAWRVGSSTSTTYATQTNNSTTAATTLKNKLNLKDEDGNSVTLYANWTPNTYSVVYHANTGVGDDVTQSCTYNKVGGYTYYGNDTTNFTKTGYSFAGWNTKADGTGSNITAGAAFTNLTATNGGVIDIYAKWQRVETKLYVNLNTYTSVNTGYQTILNTAWKATHHKWTGADISDSDSSGYSHTGDSSELATTVNHITNELICTGRYNDTDDIPNPVPTQYTLTLDYGNGWNMNGTQNSIDINSLVVGTYQTISNSSYSVPNRTYKNQTDRTFNGWTLSPADGSTGSYNSTTKAFTHGATAGDAILTASWKGSYVLYLPKVERWGYTFLGWYDNYGNLLTSQNDGLYTVVMDSNKSYSARWKLNTINIPVTVNWLDNTNVYTSRPTDIYFEMYRSNAASTTDNGTFTKSNDYILVTTATSNGTYGYNNMTNDAYDTNENSMLHNTIPTLGQPVSGDNTNPAITNQWSYTMVQLQKTNVTTGVDYVYKLKEMECKSLDQTTEYGVSYDAESNYYSYDADKYYQISNQTQWVTQSASDTYSWTNRLKNTYDYRNFKNVTGIVTFVDADDKYHFRPYAMTVKLFQNNPFSINDSVNGIRKLYDEVELKSLYPYSSSDLSKFNVWTYAFKNLPTIDEKKCTKYVYDVVLTHEDDRDKMYRYTTDNIFTALNTTYYNNAYYEYKHIDSTAYLQFDFVNNKKVLSNIYQSENLGVQGTAKAFSYLYRSSSYNLRYYYIEESNDLELRRYSQTYSGTQYSLYTENLIWNFTCTINGKQENGNDVVSPPTEYSGSNSPNDRTGVFNSTKNKNTNDDYTLTNNAVTFTNTVYNQDESTSSNADFNKIKTRANNEYFFIRLEQLNKTWSGSGDSISESYGTTCNGNIYNVVLPANGSTSLEYLPDGKYEVCVYGNNISNDVLDADFDFWKLTQVTGTNISFTSEKQTDGTYKYYITTSSQYENASTDMKHWNKIHNWRGYVDDDSLNNTDLRTSDFATDVDFKIN